MTYFNTATPEEQITILSELPQEMGETTTLTTYSILICPIKVDPQKNLDILEAISLEEEGDSGITQVTETLVN